MQRKIWKEKIWKFWLLVKDLKKKKKTCNIAKATFIDLCCVFFFLNVRRLKYAKPFPICARTVSETLQCSLWTYLCLNWRFRGMPVETNIWVLSELHLKAGIKMSIILQRRKFSEGRRIKFNPDLTAECHWIRITYSRILKEIGGSHAQWGLQQRESSLHWVLKVFPIGYLWYSERCHIHAR